MTEYAYKLWNGLIIDYYFARWEQWVTSMAAALEAETSLDESVFAAELQLWQQEWVYQSGNPYPQQAHGDAFEFATMIFDTYFTVLA